MADPERIDADCAKLTQLINNVPPTFVPNMDDFADARLEKGIVPTSLPSRSVPTPADRRIQRATVGEAQRSMAPHRNRSSLLRRTNEVSHFYGVASRTTSNCHIKNKGISHLACSSFGSPRSWPIHCSTTRTDRPQRACHTHLRWMLLLRRRVVSTALRQEHISVVHLLDHSSDQTQPADLGVFARCRTSEICSSSEEAWGRAAEDYRWSRDPVQDR
jgi:hypothetical protein